MKKHTLFFCFLLGYLLFNNANAQIKYKWAKGIGNTNGDIGTGIVIDRAGNSYVTGLLGFCSTQTNFNPDGTVPFPLTSNGSGDCFIAKYDTSGDCLWAKTFALGALSSSLGLSIAVDDAGGVYISGVFSGTVDFNPGGGASLISTGGGDSFLAKYNASNGNFGWVKQIGSSSSSNSVVAKSLAVDYAGGKVYLTGIFKGVANFNLPGVLNTLTSAGADDIFFSSYDLSGNLQWTKRIGSTNEDVASSIAVDGTGIYLTGAFSDTVDFNPLGGDTLISKGGGDIFFAKYGFSGNYLWAKSIGSPNEDLGTSIAVDTAHNVYITGYFKGTADFDPDTASSADYKLQIAGACDVFLAKYNNVGIFQWANSIAGITPVDSTYASEISINSMNDIYLIGCLKGAANFNAGGGNTYTSVGLEDVFFAKYKNSGVYGWTKTIGSTNQDVGYSIAADSIGDVFTTGSFMGTVDFDPGTATANRISNQTTKDIFIAKYNNGVSTIRGFVTHGGSALIGGNDSAKLYTQILNDGNAAMHLVDVVAIDLQGWYTFNDVPSGNYIVLAEANGGNYSSLAATYFGDSTHWQEAIPIIILTNTIDTANIHMKELLGLSGNATLSGTVKEGNGFDRGVGDPIQGTDVGLEHHPAGIIAHTTTNANGYYEFGHVPAGCYTIYVNIPGLPMDSTYNKCPTPLDTIVNLNFVADSNGININPVTTSVQQITLSKTTLLVYPNPNKGSVTIEFMIMKSNNVQLEVYNLLGEKVAELLNEEKPAGVIKCQFNGADAGLKAGIYVLKLKIGDDVSIKKITQIE